MRCASLLIALLLLAPSAQAKHRRARTPRPAAGAQLLRPCDPSWCRLLTRAERAQLGGRMAQAVGALRLPGKLKLKPVELDPRGASWQAVRLKRLPSVKKIALIERWGAGYEPGAFPYPLLFRAVFRLPGKYEAQLEVLVELLPVPAAVQGRQKSPFVSNLIEEPARIEWLLIYAQGKERKRPNIPTEAFLFLGARTEQGGQEVPEAASAPAGLAPLRAVRIYLKGPRGAVTRVLSKIDRQALQALLPATP